MSRININRELDNILLKYKVIKKISYSGAIELLNKLEMEYLREKKIGLYGVGIEADRLIYFISKHTKKFKIDICFDKMMRGYSYKNIIQDKKVYPIEKVVDTEVDYIIIGSYLYREDMIKNLKDIEYEGKVIDLYEFLDGYIFDHFVDYRMVYQTRQSYLNATEENKAEVLQKLIKEYILLKDFINAFKNIDIYVENEYIAHEQYKRLKTDLQSLLERIYTHIAERNQKDIIINWVDALSFYDTGKFPFLKKKMNEGICFENAYTVMPWTTETTKTILFGEYPIEGKLFLREDLSEQNVKLLKLLAEYGYKFGYCGMPRFEKLFDETVMVPDGCYDNKYSGSLQKQWDALGMLCNTENSMCVLIHTLRETHEPFICGNSETFVYWGSGKKDWEQELCKRQAERSGQYINEQLAFYEKFYSDHAVKIYMSDHGRVGNSPMDEKKIHIMLTVTGKGIKAEKIQRLFSLVDFPGLVELLLKDGKEWNSLTKEFAVIENLDAYNERVVQKTLSGELSREEMYQCRGIVTLADRYYLYRYGKEYYFADRDSEDNKIDDPVYEKRIEELRKLCGENFIDIFKYEKFKYSRKLYVDIERV